MSMDVATLCSFCEKEGDFPIAGPGVVICRSCVTRCVRILLGETPLPESPRIVKEGESKCDFCAKLVDLGFPQFNKNEHMVCVSCISQCLCTYLNKESGVEVKQSGVGVLYAF
ncbi:hypothetical protein FVW59_04290 [Parahaliea aestuarii]|uniref:ATP-dependent Clp protease ATP-binding subunit ClpX zinc ribbon domain-containing protein n=1 Tax=Parahaliea aestuarii TaxID=1852021 RepID=A0A5C9A0G3_9GAMM|nr:hypothetical protein FVW59_04290 [Parahaliea aestuarii]